MILTATVNCLSCDQQNEVGDGLCHHCGRSLPMLCEGARLLSYEIGKQLDASANRVTFLAVDNYRGEPCILHEVLAQPGQAGLQHRLMQALIPIKGVTSASVQDFVILAKEHHGFIAEYVEGHTLGEEVKHAGAFSEEKALTTLHEIMDVLDELHRHGVFHGDITPAHVLRQKADGQLRLICFASLTDLAMLLGQASGSAVMEGLSRVAYAPPERHVGKLSAATDIYMLGLTFICLVTASEPSEVYRDYFDTTSQMWRTEALPVREHVKQVLARMLCSEASARFQTLDELRNELTRSEHFRSCSNPACQETLDEAQAICSVCGHEFERGWLTRWEAETLEPAFASDIIEAIANKDQLFIPLQRMRIEPTALEHHWNLVIERFTGADEANLQAWLLSDLIPVLQSNMVIQTRRLGWAKRDSLVEAALSRGMTREAALAILRQECAKRAVIIKPRLMYCPSTACVCSVIHQDLSLCPESGAKLVEPSLDVWMDRLVRPALNANIWMTLQDKQALIERAVECGLPALEAERAFTAEVEQRIGAGVECFSQWVERIAAITEHDDCVTAQTVADFLAEAERLALRPEAVDQTLNLLVPRYAQLRLEMQSAESEELMDRQPVDLIEGSSSVLDVAREDSEQPIPSLEFDAAMSSATPLDDAGALESIADVCMDVSMVHALGRELIAAPVICEESTFTEPEESSDDQTAVMSETEDETWNWLSAKVDEVAWQEPSDEVCSYAQSDTEVEVDVTAHRSPWDDLSSEELSMSPVATSQNDEIFGSARLEQAGPACDEHAGDVRSQGFSGELFISPSQRPETMGMDDRQDASATSSEELLMCSGYTTNDENDISWEASWLSMETDSAAGASSITTVMSDGSPSDASQPMAVEPVESATSIEQVGRHGIKRHRWAIAAGLLLLVVGGLSVFLLRDGAKANSAPTLSMLEASSDRIQAGQEVTLTAQASDLDGDSLAYTWNASAGTIVGQGQQVVLQTSDLDPGAAQSVVIRLEVQDGHGGRVSGQKTITIEPRMGHSSESSGAPLVVTKTSRTVQRPSQVEDAATLAKKAEESLSQAQALFQSRQYDAAIQELERALKADPNNPRLRERKAAIEKVKDILNKPTDQGTN
ncbi:MAG: tetratricopeptide repeat protein [Acidobacteriota bacterium]|nr:tetratricopeptide repeat protein [Blastocatellia bacterium]MDW8240762.1 tetratricopeptide repeat protein [Acidobacteriota bacterium]